MDELVSLEPAQVPVAYAAGRGRCPACDLPLKTSSYAGHAAVHLSACYQCGGIYIDEDSIRSLDADAHKGAAVGASSFGQKGSFGSKPGVPSPQARIHAISHGLFRRHAEVDTSDLAVNTMVAIDIATDILSFFL